MLQFLFIFSHTSTSILTRSATVQSDLRLSFSLYYYVCILYFVVKACLFKEGKNRSLIHWRKTVTAVASSFYCFFFVTIKIKMFIQNKSFMSQIPLHYKVFNTRRQKKRPLFLENLNKIQSLFIMYITYNVFVLKYFLHIHVCHSVVFTYPDILTQGTREEEK